MRALDELTAAARCRRVGGADDAYMARLASSSVCPGTATESVSADLRAAESVANLGVGA